MGLFQIKSRFTAAVLFEGEFDSIGFTAAVLFEGEFDSIGLCVEAAVKAGADLRGAVLRGADLRGAVLRGADLRDADLRDADLRGAVLRGAVLRGADLRDADLRDAVLHDIKLGARGIVKSATRSDGYEFALIDCEDGLWRVLAGCRWFTLAEAREHWRRTRAGTPLGDETFDILGLFERHAARLDAAATEAA